MNRMITAVWTFLALTALLEFLRRRLARRRLIRHLAGPEPAQERGPDVEAAKKLHLKGCYFYVRSPCWVTVRLYESEPVARAIATDDDMVIPRADGEAWVISFYGQRPLYGPPTKGLP